MTLHAGGMESILILLINYSEFVSVCLSCRQFLRSLQFSLN